MSLLDFDKLSLENLEIEFAESTEERPEKDAQPLPYKVLIADDEEEIHRVTKMILTGFRFEGRGVEFIDTYSGEETKAVLRQHPDISVMLLDVVMERKDSGLDVVAVLRNEIGNKTTRVILRTGQPGEAPEESVIRDYDINDYKIKTDFTARKLKTTIYTAIRNYRDLVILERHRQGLESIIKSSAKLFEHNSYNDFLVTILEELSRFNYYDMDVVYFRSGMELDGFVTVEQQETNYIVAATGEYENIVGSELKNIESLTHVVEWMNSENRVGGLIHKLDQGFIVESHGKSALRNFIYINGPCEYFDYNLINLFLSNFSIALDNYIMNNMIYSSQKEIVYALAETVECHSLETGSHIKRISKMMHQFALCLFYSNAEAEMLKLASTMHDLGKIGMPSAILNKPGKLTSEEFEIMKTHTIGGHRILSNSGLPIMKIAGDIARSHHERYDGRGYPDQISGNDISLNARMMAIVDVFDAMTHRRVYKDAFSIPETLNYIESERGKHFDPDLVDVFVKNLNRIIGNLDHEMGC